MFENNEAWYFPLLGICFVISAVSWVGFGRHTMARVERHLISEGHQRPAPWDGVGVRIMFYASIIAFPNGKHKANPLHDLVSDIRRHATHSDQKLGLVFLISTDLVLMLGFVGWLIDVV